jgi:hypothetical protein
MGDGGFYGAPALRGCVRNGCQGFRNGAHLLSPACCLKNAHGDMVRLRSPQLAAAFSLRFEWLSSTVIIYSKNAPWQQKSPHPLKGSGHD